MSGQQHPWLASVLTTLLVATLAANASEITGFWLDEERRATVVEIRPCQSGLCGYIAWMRKPLSNGEPKRDTANPDPAARRRPLCGLQLLGGFQPAGSNEWHDGWVYNPRNGKRYAAKLEYLGNDLLRMRGYVWLPILGGHRDWIRLEAPPGSCPTKRSQPPNPPITAPPAANATVPAGK